MGFGFRGLQYPLIREDALNHNRDPCLEFKFKKFSLNQGVLEFAGRLLGMLGCLSLRANLQHMLGKTGRLP